MIQYLAKKDKEEQAMGKFSKIWDFFVSPVVLRKEKPEEMVIPVRLKSSRIKLNKKIVVPDDWWLVFAVKDKVCDILQPGTYKANENDLPITMRSGGATRRNKKGDIFPWIKCSVYYVRKGAVTNHLFRAGLPFIVKTEHLGRVKGKVEGAFSVSVSNAETFVKYLFMEYYRIGRNTGLSFVRNLVVEEINAILEHKEDTFERMIAESAFMSEVMNSIVPKHLSKIGVKVSDIQIQSFVLPKKAQKVISEYLATARYGGENNNRMVTSTGQFVSTIDEEKVEALLNEASDLSNQAPAPTIQNEEQQQSNGIDLEQILNQSVRPQLYDQTTHDTFHFEQNKEDEANRPTMTNEEEPFVPRRRGSVELDLGDRRGEDQSFARSRRGSENILDFPTRDRSVGQEEQVFDFTSDRGRGERLGRRASDDVLLGGRGSRMMPQDNETPKRDIFEGTSDKKQCKYCDKLIGIEYQFCPFCGFKQDK